MTAANFCFWLQGFFELSEADPRRKRLVREHEGRVEDLPLLSNEQVEAIRRHLSLVFAHDLDPKAGGLAVQDHLNHLHHGAKPPAGGGIARC